MIDIKKLSFSYKHCPVFDNVDLEFGPGNIYGLLGENGVGKTTLLKVICGLQRAQKGECLADGVKTEDRAPSFLKDIVFLPDDVSLPLDATPEKYVGEMGVFYPNYSYGVFEDLMSELNMDSSLKFKEMSFGMVKKSLLCCALSMGTKYVLLDEPTNGLDIPSKADFRRILSKRADENTTIIISTHQVKDVENLIDPIIIISKDGVLLNATVEEITKNLYFDYSGSYKENALYSEMMPGGYLNVVPNVNGEESNVNIEALFNAVLRNKDMVKKMFSSKN